jgi:HAD superfamily hydrolase (TIGR01549 family)
LFESSYAEFYAEERSWRTDEDEEAAERRWAERLLVECAVTDGQLEKIAQRRFGFFEMYKPVEGIFELLGELREMGFKQGIVSNWPPSLPRFLRYHGFTPWFDAIVYSAEDGVHKPDEGIFRRALGMLSVMPEETIFIGDNPEWDIVPTRAMGMTAIHFDPRGKHHDGPRQKVADLRQMILDLL